MLVDTHSLYRLRWFYGKNKVSKLPYTSPKTQRKASLSSWVWDMVVRMCKILTIPVLLVGKVIVVYVVNRLPLYYFTT